MITEGQTAPDFTLKNQEGEYVSRDGLAGKKTVLYFYVKDDTPGCTVEGKEFTDLANEFERQNTTVLGISKDTTESHKKFCEKYDLGVPLLSDETGDMLEEYDALETPEKIKRSTVLLDENGIVMKQWKTVEPEGHAREVLRYIEQAGGRK